MTLCESATARPENSSMNYEQCGLIFFMQCVTVSMFLPAESEWCCPLKKHGRPVLLQSRCDSFSYIASQDVNKDATDMSLVDGLCVCFDEFLFFERCRCLGNSRRDVHPEWIILRRNLVTPLKYCPLPGLRPPQDGRNMPPVLLHGIFGTSTHRGAIHGRLGTDLETAPSTPTSFTGGQPRERS